MFIHVSYAILSRVETMFTILFAVVNVCHGGMIPTNDAWTMSNNFAATHWNDAVITVSC